ncbi:hypothetical protein EDD37DRAFT_463562 [Exophiala viscosa]|uniref:uncharacterized protein n=1 Tax=Exophiala viscosa TaxID=2486360 RepID=UPI00218F4737|nr:hypothetical protein EDD37DRAFT_463562 [Exophiala viscosa]
MSNTPNKSIYGDDVPQRDPQPTFNRALRNGNTVSIGPSMGCPSHDELGSQNPPLDPKLQYYATVVKVRRWLQELPPQVEMLCPCRLPATAMPPWQIGTPTTYRPATQMPVTYSPGTFVHPVGVASQVSHPGNATFPQYFSGGYQSQAPWEMPHSGCMAQPMPRQPPPPPWGTAYVSMMPQRSSLPLPPESGYTMVLEASSIPGLPLSHQQPPPSPGFVGAPVASDWAAFPTTPPPCKGPPPLASPTRSFPSLFPQLAPRPTSSMPEPDMEILQATPDNEAVVEAVEEIRRTDIRPATIEYALDRPIRPGKIVRQRRKTASQAGKHKGGKEDGEADHAGRKKASRRRPTAETQHVDAVPELASVQDAVGFKELAVAEVVTRAQAPADARKVPGGEEKVAVVEETVGVPEVAVAQEAARDEEVSGAFLDEDLLATLLLRYNQDETVVDHRLL